MPRATAVELHELVASVGGAVSAVSAVSTTASEAAVAGFFAVAKLLAVVIRSFCVVIGLSGRVDLVAVVSCPSVFFPPHVKSTGSGALAPSSGLLQVTTSVEEK